MAVLVIICLGHEVGGVFQHYLAEVFRSRGGVDGSGKTLLNKQRYPAAVVDMSMSEQQRLQRTRHISESGTVLRSFTALIESCIDADS